jgi:hypothetical protein
VVVFPSTGTLGVSFLERCVARHLLLCGRASVHRRSDHFLIESRKPVLPGPVVRYYHQNHCGNYRLDWDDPNEQRWKRIGNNMPKKCWRYLVSHDLPTEE